MGLDDKILLIILERRAQTKSMRFILIKMEHLYDRLWLNNLGKHPVFENVTCIQTPINTSLASISYLLMRA